MTSDNPQSPTVYVVAGPNGAGKTTFASKFLPEFVDCREFLNADLIAAGLSPFAPERQNVRAGRLLLERIAELSAAHETFGFETTLSGRAYIRRFEQLRAEGYQLALFFLWLPNAELAVRRVANRVREGGHGVPEEDVRRRYNAGLYNLFSVYRQLVHSWWLYDASHSPPELIATHRHGKLTLTQPEQFQQIEAQGRNEHDD